MVFGAHVLADPPNHVVSVAHPTLPLAGWRAAITVANKKWIRPVSRCGQRSRR